MINNLLRGLSHIRNTSLSSQAYGRPIRIVNRIVVRDLLPLLYITRGVHARARAIPRRDVRSSRRIHQCRYVQVDEYPHVAILGEFLRPGPLGDIARGLPR